MSFLCKIGIHQFLPYQHWEGTKKHMAITGDGFRCVECKRIQWKNPPGSFKITNKGLMSGQVRR